MPHGLVEQLGSVEPGIEAVLVGSCLASSVEDGGQELRVRSQRLDGR